MNTDFLIYYKLESSLAKVGLPKLYSIIFKGDLKSNYWKVILDFKGGNENKISSLKLNYDKTGLLKDVRIYPESKTASGYFLLEKSKSKSLMKSTSDDKFSIISFEITELILNKDLFVKLEFKNKLSQNG